MKQVIVCFLVVFLGYFSIAKASEADKVRVALQVHVPEWQSFPLSDVRLEDSYFKQAMDRHKDYMLTLEPDRLIAHVRKAAGLSPKGKNYGGWETHGGCTYGHYMSSCAMMYAASGDQRFISRLDYLLAELKACQGNIPDGWFLGGREGYRQLLDGNLALNQPDETRQPWNYNRNGNTWYSIHKVLAGLRDAYEYAGRQQALDILLSLSDYITNLALKSNSDLFQSMLSVEQGGMNEVLTDVYAMTGDPKYLDAAQRFNHINVIYPVANGEDVLFGRHANDQIPKFMGVARQYEFVNNDLYLRAAGNFWDMVIRDHTLAIGGNSCYERFGRPGEESKRLDYSSAETCNTYNMLKLSRQLFMLTGNMEYLNYYETALYNHILASQDPCHAGGVTYYTSLLPGSFKQYSTPYDSFWCCVGTGMENHAKYAESIYFRQDNSLLVNLFVPSVLDWKEKGLQLTQQTRFPESDTVNIKIDEVGRFTGSLYIRQPKWTLGDMQVFINGQPACTGEMKGGYIRLSDTLKSNDRITLVMRRGLWFDYSTDEPYLGTVMYGPLVLAGELGNEGMPEDHVSDNRGLKGEMPVARIPMLVGDKSSPENWIVQTSECPLRFKVKNGGKEPGVGLIPYFQMHHQRHTIYWKIYSDSEFCRRARTLTDEVTIADEKSEKSHNLKGENDSISWHDYFWAKNTRYRAAGQNGWFSYDLKTDKNSTGSYFLICRFWGDESESHVFDILVDGKKLDTVNLSRRLYLTYVDDVFAIPQSWTKGKEKVTVTFRAGDKQVAGGLYQLKITSDLDFR